MTMTMTEETIASILSRRPSDTGEIQTYDESAPVRYRIELLPPGKLSALRIERHAYLAEHGIEECTPATAEIYDQEFQMRVLAEAVRHPDTGEPLADVTSWREHIGAAVRTCLAHYTQLEAVTDTIDMARADERHELAAYVRKEKGPGSTEFWATVDYETLLASFCALSLEHDQARAENQEAARELAELRTKAERLETSLDKTKRALSIRKARKNKRR